MFTTAQLASIMFLPNAAAAFGAENHASIGPKSTF